MPEPSSHLPQGVVGLTLAPGDRVQHYTVVELIGAGGTSAVFKAHDALLNRHVAIKQILLAPGEEADTYRARALAEAGIHKRAGAVDPSMLVQLMDVVSDPRGVLLITEYVDGPSLEQIFAANPAPMEERQALGILAGAAKGLSSLHGAGILHRDMKPANVLMPRAGGLRLADFGLSVSASSSQLMDQGTVRYLAPEVLQGQPASPASDLYALGMIAYEMLAGRGQYEEVFKAILRDQRNQSMRWVKWHTNPKIKPTPLGQLNPTLSPALLELVERLMDKDPLRRIGSAGDLLNAIRTIAAAPAPSAHTEGPPPPWLARQRAVVPTSPAGATARIPRRKAWPAVAAGVGALMLLAAVGALWVKENSKPDPALAERIQVLALMNQGEAAWEAGDVKSALACFESMRDGGEHARNPGTLSRKFADAGAAKSRFRLAFNQKDYTQAAAALADFERYAKALEADASYPPAGLKIVQRLQTEVAAVLKDELGPRKNVADAIARMQQLLDADKITECMDECTKWLKRAGLLPEEQAKITALRAQCSLSRKELAIERLLDRAKTAAAGDPNGAIHMLNDEIKMRGELVDPRIPDLLESIVRQVKLDQLVARYRAAQTPAEKIGLLNAVLALNPEFADKNKLPGYRAERLLEEARQAAAADDWELAEKLAARGLGLAPGHAELGELGQKAARQLGDKKLLAEAEALLDAGDFAAAQAAYEKAARTVGDKSQASAAREKVVLCRGKLKVSEAVALIKEGDYQKAEQVLKAAQDDLPEDADVAASFERIAELRGEEKLRRAADEAFKREDYAAAVPAYIKLAAYIEAHPTTGEAELTAERLRISRFESSMIKCKLAMDRSEWASAKGFLSSANTYAKSAEEKKRVKQRIETLEEISPK